MSGFVHAFRGPHIEEPETPHVADQALTVTDPWEILAMAPSSPEIPAPANEDPSVFFRHVTAADIAGHKWVPAPAAAANDAQVPAPAMRTRFADLVAGRVAPDNDADAQALGPIMTNRPDALTA